MKLFAGGSSEAWPASTEGRRLRLRTLILRSIVHYWRSNVAVGLGVAVGAGVPILLTHLDYPQKVVGIGPTFEPTGNIDEDLASIRGSYHRRWAKYPAQF